MKPFESESQRYEYPLTPESVVVDCGAYKGEFSRKIIGKYGCKVIAFEPCMDFYAGLKRLEETLPGFLVFRQAVADHEGIARLNIRNDSTGLFMHSDEAEIIGKVNLVEFLEGLNVKRVDLLKLNVEGAEFMVLESILEKGAAKMFSHVQVQFHDCVPDADKRRAIIVARLTDTHDVMWGTKFVWESYKLRP
jgi:FkbM family methyltransferase